MRMFFILLFLVFLIGVRDVSWADSNKSKHPARRGYLQQDVLFKNRTNIYDQRGRRKGYAEQDPLFKDTKVIYDKDGLKKGYLKQDPIFEDRTNILKSSPD